MFESPSAFSIFFKRMVTPGRKADDGWKTVKFQGKFLDHYKMELARRREGMLLRRVEALLLHHLWYRPMLTDAARPVQKPLILSCGYTGMIVGGVLETIAKARLLLLLLGAQPTP